MSGVNGAAKCDVCGRFRSWTDVIAFDAGDTYVPDIAVECKTCTAPANLKEATR